MKQLYACCATVALLLGVMSPPEVQAQTFSLQSSALPAVSSHVDWGDFDNDGDLDVAVARPATDVGFSIFRNDGGGAFSQHAIFPVTTAQSAKVLWADMNNDGFLDVLLVGNVSSSGLTKLYKGSSTGVFTEVPMTAQGNVFVDYVDVGDYDNDGDLDLVFLGYLQGNGPRVRLVRNEGNFAFTLVQNTGLPNYEGHPGVAQWKDIDNDGDLDLFISGGSNSYPTSAANEIYLNNGNETFTKLLDLGLTTTNALGASWGDYNNDGFQDLLVNGRNTSTNVYFTKVFKNNGNKTFTEQTDIVLEAIGTHNGCFAEWGDYNNDGLLDIGLIGSMTVNGSTKTYSRMYTNQGNNRFVADLGFPALTEIIYRGGAWGDYDNDGKNDMLLSGFNTLKLYKNTTQNLRAVPQEPTGLSVSTTASGAVFTWNKALVNGIVQHGLTYNISLYDVTNTKWVSMPAAFGPGDLEKNGRRQLVKAGAIQHSLNGYSIDNLPSGNYKWTVQAVDGRLMGGKFAAEQTFSHTNLKGVALHVGNGQLSNTTTNIQYSLNSTDGINGTWLSCAATTTNLNLGNGGFAVWVRQADKISNTYKVATVAARAAAPAYSIDFIGERTAEIVAFIDEYASNATFTGATAGFGRQLTLTPGTTLYFRTKGTATTLASYVQTLVVPARPAVPNYTIDFYGETTAQAVKTSDQYSIYSSMTGATKGTGVKITLTPGQTLYFNTPATTTNFASAAAQVLTAPARPATPSYSINYVQEQTAQQVPATVGYSTSASMTFPSTGNWVPVPLGPGQTYYFAVLATNTSFKSATFTLVVPARPATPAFTIDYFAETTAQLATSADEYSKNADMSAALTGSGVKIALNPGSTSYYLYLRKKATSSSYASGIQQLLVKDRAFTPSYAIDYKTETTTTFVNTYDEYAYEANMSGATSGDLSHKAAVIPGRTLYIRAKATTARFASVPLALVAAARPAAPAYGINFENETTDRVVPATHEYAANSSMTNATTGWDEALTVTPGSTVYLRIKATTTAFASEIKTLTASARPVTPAYTINYTAETTQQGVLSTDVYATNANMTSAIAGTGVSIALTPGQALYFQKKATTTSFKSAVQTLAVPARPAAPAYTIDFAQEKTREVFALTDEYSLQANMSAAVNGTGSALVLTPGQTLYFRKKASASSFKSGVSSLAVPARPSTPAYAIDYVGEETSQPVAGTDEYASGEAMASAVAGTGAKVSLIPGQAMYFRVRATASSFKSAVQALAVPARAASPSYSINYAAEKTNETVPATDEVSVHATMSAASPGTGATYSLVPGQNAYFRKKATATSFASETYVLEVSPRPAAPANGVVDDENNTFGWTYLAAYPAASSYEYSADGGSNWKVCTTNPVAVGPVAIAAGALQLRIKAGAQNFRGEALLSEAPFTLALGVQDVFAAGIKLYPNPTAGRLMIDQLQEEVVMQVISLSGKIVMSRPLRETLNQVDISELPAGIYLLQLKGKTLHVQSRIVKH